MSVIKSKLFLQNLIQTGADASLNLFVVHFKPYGETEYDDELSLRTTQFPTPSRDISTASLVYQNIELKTLAPSSTISREITFNVRLDNYYKVIDRLRSYQCIDENGLFVKDIENSFTITVDALRPYDSLTTSEQYISTYRWVFNDAYITSIGQWNYSYDSATTGTTTVGFVFSKYQEYPVDISMEQKTFKEDLKTIKDGIEKYIAVKKANRQAIKEAKEAAREAEEQRQKEEAEKKEKEEKIKQKQSFNASLSPKNKPNYIK